MSGGEAAFQIREAGPADVASILEMIRELAEYEKLADQVEATEELLSEALFGERPAAEALIAERDSAPIGYALFFPTFSTFLAIQGIWLEDIYVRPEHRKGGAGRALLASVAAKLRERGGSRLEWSALDWNELALGFYRGLGARGMTEWITHRLIGEDLAGLAAEAPPLGPAPRR
ncbi:MAG TPA: GNAT family N-acetyltransferase [Solirubrobacteraceae bacterium]|nr:GNAT family N-acetyltransferase [Solirubrobacteraceae bacterium]